MSQPPRPTPPDDTRALLDFVADRDVSCPRCGYNLRALASTTCPECGEALTLQVGSRDTKLGTWALANAGLYLVVGGQLILLILVAEQGLSFFYRVNEYILFAIGLVVIPISISMSLRHRRFAQYKARTQRIITYASWLTVLYFFAMFYKLYIYGY